MRTVFFLLFTFMISNVVNAGIILLEDFEDSTVSYSSSVADDLSDISSRDYFGRIASDTASPPADVLYNNIQGNGYFGVQDTDGANSGNIDTVTLDWTGISINNFTGLSLSWFVAEDSSSDGEEDWDSTTSFQMLFQIDGGGFQVFFAIESELGTDADFTNEAPHVDTNFNGEGDGTEITDTFTQYSYLIGATGSLLDIKVVFDEFNAGDEDLAFDNLLLSGDIIEVPEPSIFAIFALGMIGLAARRFKKQS